MPPTSEKQPPLERKAQGSIYFPAYSKATQQFKAGRDESWLKTTRGFGQEDIRANTLDLNKTAWTLQRSRTVGSSVMSQDFLAPCWGIASVLTYRVEHPLLQHQYSAVVYF